LEEEDGAENKNTRGEKFSARPSGRNFFDGIIMIEIFEIIRGCAHVMRPSESFTLTI
jgi:hypothetical protein